MQLFIVLHDDEEVCHKEFESEFADGTTLEQLKEKIRSEWEIDKEDQQLFFFNGDEIFGFNLNSTLSEIGLKHMDEVIVKCADLTMWDTLQQKASIFNESNVKEDSIQLACELILLVNSLKESNFFKAYPEFGSIYDKKYSKYFRLTDKRQDTLKKTAKSYFEEFYYNLQRSKAKVRFAAKEEGIRSGIIVIVDHCQGATKYFMKTGHDAGSSGSAAHCPPNLKELFAYKLLERIGAGPIVHFPDNSYTTVFVVYIATEEVQGLRVIKELGDEELTDGGFRSIVREKIVQAYLILLLFGLADLNEENFGLNAKHDLSIFGFWVNNINGPDKALAHFLDPEANFGIRWEKRCLLLKEANEESRRMIAKESLKQWNISENLAFAERDLQLIKNKFRAHGVEFAKGTEDLDKYISSISDRLKAFESM